LPRGSSLHEAADIQHVRRHGRIVRGRFLRIQAIEDSPKNQSLQPFQSFSHSPQPQSRIAIVTSRRVGSAVERNLARRRIREIFRVMRGDFSSAWMFVITVQAAATNATFEELRLEFLAHYEKLTQIFH